MPASKYLKDLSAAAAKAETAIRNLESEPRGPDAAGNVKWIREIRQTIDLLAEKVAILTRESASASMAKEIDSYPAWKKAVKKLGATKIRGDKDIAEAIGPDGKVLGEWDGVVGILFQPGGGYKQLSRRRARMAKGRSLDDIENGLANAMSKVYTSLTNLRAGLKVALQLAEDAENHPDWNGPMGDLPLPMEVQEMIALVRKLGPLVPGRGPDLR